MGGWRRASRSCCSTVRSGSSIRCRLPSSGSIWRRTSTSLASRSSPGQKSTSATGCCLGGAIDEDHADAAARAEGQVAALRGDRSVVEQAQAVAREDRREHELHLVDGERGADAAPGAAAERDELERREL